MLFIDNVSKAFGDHLAASNLSLRVEPGEIYGLLGPNGAGKTTTLSMIAGLLIPDAGCISLADGLSLDNPLARLQLGLARSFLPPAGFPVLPCARHVRMCWHWRN